MKEKIKEPEEKLGPWHSFEEWEAYVDQLSAYEKQKWGILYPIKSGIEHLIY